MFVLWLFRDFVMYAVVRSGNKQFPVRVGSILKVDRLSHDEGSSFVINDVVFAADSDGAMIEVSSIGAVVLEHALDDKVIIFKKKRRKNHRRKRGFRHSVTFIKIDSINV